MGKNEGKQQQPAEEAKPAGVIGQRVASYLVRVTVYDRDGDVTGRWDLTNGQLGEQIKTALEYENGYDCHVSAERTDR